MVPLRPQKTSCLCCNVKNEAFGYRLTGRRHTGNVKIWTTQAGGQPCWGFGSLFFFPITCVPREPEIKPLSFPNLLESNVCHADHATVPCLGKPSFPLFGCIDKCRANVSLSFTPGKLEPFLKADPSVKLALMARITGVWGTFVTLSLMNKALWRGRQSSPLSWHQLGR